MARRFLTYSAIALQILAAALTLTVTIGAARGGEPAPAPAAGEVLGAGSVLRVFLVGETDCIRLASGELAAVRVGHADRMEKVKHRRSALPPKGWTAAEFDDGPWPVRSCPVLGDDHRNVSMICVRARFLVDDPARAAGLELALGYRGGAVVCLNGREVGRGHMPSGEVKPETPAEPYPKEAWVNPEGLLLRWKNGGFGDPGKYADRFKLRERSLDRLKLPADALRKGVNVLAVELHRPLTDAIFYEAKTREGNKEYAQWDTVRLISLRLAGAPGTSASGRAGLEGLAVWNRDAAGRIGPSDRPVAGEKLGPVIIRGARNGSFSAQVVAGSARPIRGLSVEVSDLKGPGTIPAASAVLVRYALPDGRTGGKEVFFDGLERSAPAEVPADRSGVAVQPVWITVTVPRDAKPGEYQGRLTVRAEGAAAVETPVKLAVADWTIPDAKDSASYYWLVQSPEALALRYDVPMWSDRHWELLGRSFELMAQVGTRIVYVPMFPQAHQGNEHAMVRQIRDEKAPGGYRQDFSVFEKYLDMALAKLGRIEVVCLQCWPISTGGSYFGGGHTREPSPVKLTVLDAAGGKLETVDGPRWGQPASREFWKPVLAGVRERLAKRGLAGAMMVGIGHDTVPPKECVEDLKAAAPEAKWVVHCHPKQWAVHGVPTGYLSNVWGMPPARFPDEKRAYGWKEEKLWTTFPRFGSGIIDTLRNASPPAQYRLSLEGALCAGIKGYGWIGADCWPVAVKKGGREVSLLDYYTYDKRNNLGIAHSVTAMLAPGRDGPLATVRLEMVRQGLEEAEARVYLERALTDPARRARLGDELAGRCQKLLDERLTALLWGLSDWDLARCADPDRLAAELYALAAEAAAKLGN